MDINSSLSILLSLVRSALWDFEPDTGALSGLNRQDWMQILDQARRQTVTGLVYLALEKYPIKVPEDLPMELVRRANQIVNRNVRMRAVESSALALFQGLHPVIMKGSVCAARYPSPQMREAGDIDLYFSPEEYPLALGRIPVPYSVNSDEGVHFTMEKRVVEIHSRYYDLHTSKVPEPATPEGELLMLAAHIFKHAAGPGVGLRQICDFALAYNAFTGDPESVFRDAGMEKWLRVLLSFVHDYLDPSVSVKRYMNPKPLLRIVERSGNFGHHSASRSKSLHAPAFFRKADTTLRLLSHLPFSLRYSPREAFHRIKDLI